MTNIYKCIDCGHVVDRFDPSDYELAYLSQPGLILHVPCMDTKRYMFIDKHKRIVGLINQDLLTNEEIVMHSGEMRVNT